MIFIITGPSGVGKNTIINELSNRIDFHFSTSYTTRPKRDNETEGQDYYFITDQQFNDLIDKNHMLEYEEYGGYFYGTPKSEINRDGIVILDLEVNGATKLIKSNSDYIGIFIDINDDELINRLVSRGHDEDFINIYKVNVIGPYQMIRAVEPIMKENGFGSVVNISSIAGKTGIGSSIAYAASKGALNTMTLSLAKALGPEIRVNTVCPGFIGTGWFENRFGKETFDRIKKDQESITPLNKAGTPDDIADSAVFFCLEGAEHITGETLISDAGMHLNLPKG